MKSWWPAIAAVAITATAITRNAPGWTIAVCVTASAAAIAAPIAGRMIRARLSGVR